MRVQTKFVLIFAGYAVLLVICGFGLFDYNRGVQQVVAGEAARSARHIVAQVVDGHQAPYYCYLKQLRLQGHLDRLIAGETEGSVHQIASALECFDIDGFCVFNSSFERQYRQVREGAFLPDPFPVFASFGPQMFTEQDERHFFTWYEEQLLEIFVAAVRISSEAPDGYIAIARAWNAERLLQMDLTGTRNIEFRLFAAEPLLESVPQAFVVQQELKDWSGRTVAYLHAEYNTPLSALHELLEREAVLQVLLPGTFAFLLMFCLLFWVIWPLRRLEGALARGDAGPLKNMRIHGRSNEFGKIAALIGDFFTQRMELEQARDTAQNASLAKNRFLATLSHEIRTPMNSMVGMIDLLKQGELSGDQGKLIGILDRSCEGLLCIINDMLDFSRIEAGKLRLNPEEFNMYQLAEDLELAAVQLRGEKQIGIDLFIDPELPRWLIGDEGRIRQVLLNLISNAVKFTDHGHVQISIFVRQREAAVCHLLFLVADTGIGIHPDKHAHIFQTYAQATTSESLIAGSGLGLAICRKLVDLMGGTIGLESQLGEGALFSVELDLPVAEMSRMRVPDASGHSLKNSGPLDLAVLVVEDQSLNAQVLSRMLQQLGCRTAIAENGIVALEKMGQSAYDVILMDCHMPLMDGYECTRAIRQQEQGTAAHMTIIAVTADAMPGTRERCLACGMDDYMSKPILLAGLRKTLSKYMS